VREANGATLSDDGGEARQTECTWTIEDADETDTGTRELVLYLSKRNKANLWQSLFQDEIEGFDEITDTVCDQETPREIPPVAPPAQRASLAGAVGEERLDAGELRCSWTCPSTTSLRGAWRWGCSAKARP
jgi:hypothetical protein